MPLSRRAVQSMVEPQTATGRQLQLHHLVLLCVEIACSILYVQLQLQYRSRRINQYIKILVVCASVRDGCGRGNSLKLLLLGPQRVERDERHAIVGACHRTSNGQEHKIIRRAEPERDTIFHLRVTACRGRGSHRQDKRLAL